LSGEREGTTFSRAVSPSEHAPARLEAVPSQSLSEIYRLSYAEAPFTSTPAHFSNSVMVAA
jgi:hypothetical protein